MPEREKFDLIIDYVKANFNWDGTNDKYASKSPNEFMKEKHGNCADINLFATGLLNASGIEAYPVLISTRKHGKIKFDYPFTHFFNYVLITAKVEGKNVISDATEILESNDMIPPRCLNDKGLIMNKDKVEWADLVHYFPSEEQTELFINIGTSVLNAKIVCTSTQYDALHYRNKYGNDKSILLEEMSEKSYSIIDSSIVFRNYTNAKEDFIVDYKVNMSPEIINDKIYCPPFLNEPVTENPLKQKDRSYPIDMKYPMIRRFNSTIEVPAGYKLDFAPPDFKIENDLFELNYSTKSDSTTIHIFLKYYFKKPVYQANEYSKIKGYFNEIVKIGNQKIVFSKKEVNNK